METENTYHDEQEMRKAAPVLFSMDRKRSPFCVPEQYFTQFPDKVSTLVLLKKESSFAVPGSYFETLPEKLKSLTLQNKTASVFDVPEGYFERLPHAIQERAIRKEDTAERAFFPRIAVPALALAAVVVIVFAINLKLNQSSEQQASIAMNISTLSSEEAEGSLLETADENFLIENAVAATETTEPAHDAISDYLIENHIELNTLANEL